MILLDVNSENLKKIAKTCENTLDSGYLILYNTRSD